jgi:hypothetical protein
LNDEPINLKTMHSSHEAIVTLFPIPLYAVLIGLEIPIGWSLHESNKTASEMRKEFY